MPYRGERRWNQMVDRFPKYLVRLLTSRVYGRGVDRDPPPRNHGVYLFTERGRNLYVGRCGLTERARLAGAGYSNFRTRLAGHTLPSSNHNKATFAWRLTVDALARSVETVPLTRAERQLDKHFSAEFLRQKQRVTAMEFRIVEIDDDFESYVFEPFAAAVLETPYNSWATS